MAWRIKAALAVIEALVVAYEIFFRPSACQHRHPLTAWGITRPMRKSIERLHWAREGKRNNVGRVTVAVPRALPA